MHNAVTPPAGRVGKGNQEVGGERRDKSEQAHKTSSKKILKKRNMERVGKQVGKKGSQKGKEEKNPQNGGGRPGINRIPFFGASRFSKLERKKSEKKEEEKNAKCETKVTPEKKK